MEKQEKQEKRSKKVYIPLIIVVLAVVLGGLIYYYEYSKYISTDDAKVDSDNVAISPKILGRISKLYFKEQDSVKKGDLIAELDSTDIIAQKQQAEAAVNQAATNKSQAVAKLNLDRENIKVLQVSYERALEDFNRAKEQFSGEVITKEQYDHAKKTLEAAKAQLGASQSQVEVSKVQIKSAEAAVKNAATLVGVYNTQLKNTKLYAPMTGVVAKRWLLEGDVVQPSQAIYTVTNTKNLWVVIYIEETKLADVYLGQPAVYTLDAFDGTKFLGKVFSIGSNTASMFSLIPANNASGNFTKVTQRVAVKISIDSVKNGSPLSDYRVISGMSAVVKLIKK